MHQLSKLIRSRDDWKDKAVSRADEIRERRKTEKRHLGKIAELKRQVEELKQAAGGNKEEPAPAAGDIAGAGQAAAATTKHESAMSRPEKRSNT